MEESALLSYYFGLEKNESNYDVNTYHDVRVGIAFTKKLGF